jgi:hypothetical protein
VAILVFSGYWICAEAPINLAAQEVLNSGVACDWLRTSSSIGSWRRACVTNPVISAGAMVCDAQRQSLAAAANPIGG